MINNKIPFGLLSKEDQDLFKNVGKGCLEFWSRTGWSNPYPVNSDFCTSVPYRLKLKEGDWYTAKTKNHSFFCKCGVVTEDRIYNEIDGMYLIFDELEVFRPATKEEIESVNPKDEGFVDVEIEWETGSPRFKGDTPWGNSNCSAQYYIGECVRGWILSKYIFDDQFEAIGAKFTAETAIIFNDDGTKIAIKATHSRFIKL